MSYLVLYNTLLAIVCAQAPVTGAPSKPQDAAVTAPQDPTSHNVAQSPPQTPAQAPATQPETPSVSTSAPTAGHDSGHGLGPGLAEVKPPTPPNFGSGTSPSRNTTTGNATLPTEPGTNTTVTPTLTRIPGPAVNPLPPGTNNCLKEPFCGSGEECFVLTDGLVCLPKPQNWGFILSKNASGIPSVPSWSGPFSQLNDSCARFQMPASSNKPGLALLVYDLIRDTLPKDLLLSRFDQSTTNWYTHFSNCEPNLICSLGICQLRPTLGESCTTSWECNALALGLDEFNLPIPTANTTEMRCEYLDGDKSVNTTCQLLHREKGGDHGFVGDRNIGGSGDGGGGGFSAWHVIVPVVVILIVIYFGTVAYQRRMRQQKRRKWTWTIE
ncbi:hypothetical protein BGZ97_009148, partial [Linnemannia gamsii]